ncbi:Enhancer of polycomb-like transcription factor protein [Zea mays]|nr:Enhancer of polycomb-like transcription factor protein [Zea mays]
MDSDVHSEQRICVKLAEGTKYAHKVCQVLQPGATNRYTHAMMWKGGAEWCLEFPDRSQWLIFKQMHDECYSHNIRAASVRNIPTPGVHLVGIHDDNDMVSFVRSEDYLVHIGTDVEIALDEARVLYNMDSDDEEWISSRQKFLVRDNNATLELAEDLFERVMDKLEKFAYSHDSNELSIVQMKELETDDLPLDIIEVIHAYWQAKRQKKGMPLIRHFQFAMWKVYEQQLHEWESKVCRMQGSSNGYQGKKMPPKPALFAFCLRPRGLDVPYKGPKQRSHKKLMSTGCHSFSRQHDGFYRQGSLQEQVLFGHLSPRKVLHQDFSGQILSKGVQPLLSLMITSRRLPSALRELNGAHLTIGTLSFMTGRTQSISFRARPLLILRSSNCGMLQAQHSTLLPWRSSRGKRLTA